jgi:hypothetical protein
MILRLCRFKFKIKFEIFFISQLGEYSRNLAVRLQELQQELEITKGNNTPRYIRKMVL